MSEVKLRAFHGDAGLKKQLIAEVRKHRQADRLVRGSYGNGCAGADFKGCSVACSLESLGRLQGKEYPLNCHKMYEEAAGAPEILARLQDLIFEGLNFGQAMLWPERFWRAIPVSADLRPVGMRFLAWIFGDEKFGIWRYWEKSKHQTTIKAYAELKMREADGKVVHRCEWKVMRVKLKAAASVYAAYAAYAAATDAASDAAAAYAATDAADAAAAYAAIQKTSYKIQADKLIELLKGARP